MRRAERASCSSAYQLLRAYLHTSPRRRTSQVEPKSDTERARLGLPLREPWFETKPFDEKKKCFVLRLKDILQAQPNQKMEIADLGQLRQELDVVRQGKQRKIATYVRRFPAAFILHSFYTHNNKKKTWCSFSADALKLLEEEALIFQASEALLLQKLRKLLMISMKNRLPFATVQQVRESLGLPVDFKESLVNKYPDVFLLKERKGSLYLELKAWDETLAVSALEKHAQGGYCSKTKKNKKQRSERVAAVGEGEGHEEIFSNGTPHEGRFLLKEEDELMIPIDEGEAHENEALCRRGQEQSTSSKEEDEQADKGDKETTFSALDCETEGYQQGLGHELEAKGLERNTLAMTDDLQHDTPVVSSLLSESFQDEALATPKVTHRPAEYLSGSALKKHQQDAVVVSDVEPKTGRDEIRTLSSNGTDAYQQGIVPTYELGLENGRLESTASTANMNVTHHSKLFTVSDLGSEACIDNISFETEAYQQENAIYSGHESNEHCQESTTMDNPTAEAHEHQAPAFSDLEMDNCELEISAFSALDGDDQHQAVSDLEGTDQCHKSISGGTMADVLIGAGNEHHSRTNGQKQSQSLEDMHRSSACLHFPWKNKKGKQPRGEHAAEIEAFQSAPYIAPYRNSRDLELPLKSLATEKFVVGVLHEFLSLTLEKRATIQQLELFKRQYRLPGNLLDFLVKYDGIFYVVRGRTKSHVFLKEAYKESMLLEKDPLVLWQERFVELAFSTSKPEECKPIKGSLPQHAQSLCNEV